MSKQLQPPKNFRAATGKRNCSNCGHRIVHSNGITITWYKCERPGEIINDQGNLVEFTTVYFVCDGHKRRTNE